MDRYEKWCNDFKTFWKEKQIDNIISLFDRKVIYYETPTNEINSIDEIRKIWEEIRNQNTNNINFKILCRDSNKCIANYILKDKVSYDMIYEIVLNNENKCIYFKQWYMEI